MVHIERFSDSMDTRFSFTCLAYQQISSYEQVHERRSYADVASVLEDASQAGLLIANLSLDHAERVLFRTEASLECLDQIIQATLRYNGKGTPLRAAVSPHERRRTCLSFLLVARSLATRHRRHPTSPARAGAPQLKSYNARIYSAFRLNG